MAGGPKDLVLLAGTPGTKRAVALQRISARAASAGRRVASQDVDAHLRALVIERIKEGGYLADALKPDKEPTAQNITWKLAQDLVCKLWGEALNRALTALEAEEADVHVLVSHLTYYRGETHEFYSPAARGWEALRTNAVFKVARVLTLIDDIYDAYLRLCKVGEVFDIQRQIAKAYSTLQHDGSDKPKGDSAEYGLAFGIVVRTLLRLLAWREKEILTAENLAGQSGAKALVLSVKHPVAMGVGLLFGDYEKHKQWELAYLSHPISRPRRTEKKDKRWPQFVWDFHEFITALYAESSEGGTRCLPVMPTAIDEFRILKEPGTDRFIPALATRWPLLDERSGALLYELPDAYTRYDDYERDEILPIFNPPRTPEGKRFADTSKIWDSLDEQTRSEVSGQLRALVMTIDLQMANRDHLLVRQCPGFLLYRPLYGEGRFSDGVTAELTNRKNIVEGLSERRPLFFIHTSEDTSTLKIKVADLVKLWEQLRMVVKEKAQFELPEDIPDGVSFESPDWFERIVVPRSSELSSGSVSAGDALRLQKHKAEIVAVIEKSIAEIRTDAFMAGADDAFARWKMFDEILEYGGQKKAERQALWKTLVKRALTDWLDSQPDSTATATELTQ